MGDTGLVSIHDEGANIGDPMSDLGRIYFHSDLDYLQILQTHTGTLSLPSVGSYNLYYQVYTLGAHNLGVAPVIIGRVGVTPITGSFFIQAAGGATSRRIEFGADANYFYARVQNAALGNNLPATSLSYELNILSATGV